MIDLSTHVISRDELAPFCRGDDWVSLVKGLLAQQQQTWGMLRAGLDGLRSVRTKSFDLDGCTVRVQLNPGRLASTSSKVDEQSIRERKCFLCHLLPEQRGLLFENDYLIVCNPFPIFAEHLTVPHREHRPQSIRKSFGTLLSLSRAMGGQYTLFYNGPKCGASAPDHLHFQAGERGFMPINGEYAGLISARADRLLDTEMLRVFAVERSGRRFISMESSDSVVLCRTFECFYGVFQQIVTSGEEPMMNLLASHDSGAWRVIVFPREKHRPNCFFREDDERIVLSPGAVDLGGVLVTAREEDFERITRNVALEVLEDVLISAEEFAVLKSRITEVFAGHS